MDNTIHFKEINFNSAQKFIPISGDVYNNFYRKEINNSLFKTEPTIMNKKLEKIIVEPNTNHLYFSFCNIGNIDLKFPSNITTIYMYMVSFDTINIVANIKGNFETIYFDNIIINNNVAKTFDESYKLCSVLKEMFENNRKLAKVSLVGNEWIKDNLSIILSGLNNNIIELNIAGLFIEGNKSIQALINYLTYNKNIKVLDLRNTFNNLSNDDLTSIFNTINKLDLQILKLSFYERMNEQNKKEIEKFIDKIDFIDISYTDSTNDDIENYVDRYITSNKTGMIKLNNVKPVLNYVKKKDIPNKIFYKNKKLRSQIGGTITNKINIDTIQKVHIHDISKIELQYNNNKKIILFNS